MKPVTFDAKHFYEWFKEKPKVDYNENGTKYIMYYNGAYIEDHDYCVNNIELWFDDMQWAIDLYPDRLSMIYDDNYIKIKLENISTDSIEESLFQLSTIQDISIFEVEDLKYLIKVCKLLD